MCIKKYGVDSRTGLQRGYAFVHYATSEAGRDSALAAVSAVTKVMVFDGIKLFVDLSRNFGRAVRELSAQTRESESHTVKQHVCHLCFYILKSKIIFQLCLEQHAANPVVVVNREYRAQRGGRSDRFRQQGRGMYRPYQGRYPYQLHREVDYQCYGPYMESYYQNMYQHSAGYAAGYQNGYPAMVNGTIQILDSPPP